MNTPLPSTSYGGVMSKDSPTLPQPSLCPSCGHKTTFTYGGEQHWPAEVCRRTGLKPRMVLWTCDHCHTTLSDASFNQQ